jgi:hypothetical protein
VIYLDICKLFLFCRLTKFQFVILINFLLNRKLSY